jgi:hypothetical protein
MANPTTNFGWVMPTATDLVTDLPADFNVFGQAVDTSLQYLLGGTTGQVLSKTSNTNMAFTWVTDPGGDITGVTAGTGISGGGTTGTVTVTNSMATAITTAGDLIKGTGSGTFDRLGIGSTGQVLTVAAGAPAWATPAGGGGKVLQVVQGSYSTITTVASTTFTDTGLSLSITPTSATSKILIIANQQSNYSRSTYDCGHNLRILRGATDIFTMGGSTNAGYMFIQNGTQTEKTEIVPLTYLDSPATTSATTYKIQGRSYSTASSGQAQYQYSNGLSVITLLEIGA